MVEKPGEIMVRKMTITACLIVSGFALFGCQEWEAQWQQQLAARQSATTPEPAPDQPASPRVASEEEVDQRIMGKNTIIEDGSTAKAVQEYIESLQLAATSEEENAKYPEAEYGVSQGETRASPEEKEESNEKIAAAEQAERAAHKPVMPEEPLTQGTNKPRASMITGDSSLGINTPLDLSKTVKETQYAAGETPTLPKVLAVALTGDSTVTPKETNVSEPSIHEGLNLAYPKRAATLSELIEHAQEFLEEDPANPEKQWHLSLLQLVAGREKGAAEVSSALAEESRLLITDSVDAVTALGRLLRDPLAGSGEALKAVERLRRSLQAEADLQIPAIALCTRVETFGRYDEIPPRMLRPYQANRVIVYCEVRNFLSRLEDSGLYHALVSSRFELFTKEGQSLWVHEEQLVEDLSKQHRQDLFLAQVVTFPADLQPDEYVLKVTVTDQLANKTNEANHRFVIED